MTNSIRSLDIWGPNVHTQERSKALAPIPNIPSVTRVPGICGMKNRKQCRFVNGSESGVCEVGLEEEGRGEVWE